MNSRRLLAMTRTIRTSFLTAEASRDIFQGFSRGIFHRGRHVVFLEYTQDFGPMP